MRFRKRLSAAVLAAVMMLSSMQIPGGTSYAAEIADDGITSGQTASILTEEGTEDTEDTEAWAKNPADEGAITDDESQTDNDNPAGDDSQTEDGNPSGDDSQTDHENGSEEEPDEGQVSDDDTEEPSEDTEEPGTEETEEAEAGLKDIDQMDDMTSDAGGITTYADSIDVKDYVYQQMQAGNESIAIKDAGYDVKYSNFRDMMAGLMAEHIELYCGVKKYVISMVGWEPYAGILSVEYLDDEEEAAFNAKVDEALSCVEDGMNDDVKAAVLHDYLALNVNAEYNTSDYSAPYYVLVEGKGFSSKGYALAYRYLLSKAGIECQVVTGSGQDTWNVVKLDGEYYHVSVEADDLQSDMVGRVYHTKMFFTDEDTGLTEYQWHVISDGKTDSSTYLNYRATNTKYKNAFWRNSNAPLVFDGTDCYYISNVDGSKGLRKASFSDITNTGTLVTGIDAWTVNPDAKGGIYSGLYMIDGRLFYNDQDSIYSIKPDGSDKKTEFTPEKTDDNRIYYSAYRNGEVVYGMHTGPELSEKQTVLTAKIEGIGGSEPPEEGKTYNIIYVLDGGTNDKDNPGTYTAETAAIILKDAVKEGYDFEGWYKDETFKQKVTKISEGSTGNITLYAKFSKKGVGLNRENPAYEFYTLDDTIVTSTASGKPKILIFGRNQSGVENTLGNIKRELDKSDSPLHGVDIYLVGTDSEKNNILNLSKAHRSNEIVYTYDKDGNNENIQKEYKQLAAPGGGSQNPTIAYIDENNNLQYVYSGISASTGKEPTAAEIIEALKEYCNYKCYTITYELDGGTNSSKNPAIYTAQTETITLAAAVRTGYVFEGWYSDAEFNEPVTEIVKGSRGDLTLYAKWTRTGEGNFSSDVKEQLYKRMLEREAQIDYQDAPDLQGRLDDLAAVVLDEHPELYFVKGYDVKGTVLEITYYDAANYDDDAFIAKADEALSYVTDGMSDDVKAAVLHDYLAINAEWDYDYNDEDQGAFNNAYGVLVNGTAIDKGYALAYKYLLSRAGIESYLVTSESMNHTWNLVKLGEEYYHVDVAYDEGVASNFPDMVGFVSHNNLFRSDTNFGKHKEWKVLYGNDTVDCKATDTKYENAFWVESTAPLVFDGTDCYYISEDGSISADGSSIEYGLRKQSFSDIDGVGTLVAKIDKSWKTYVDLSDGSTMPFAVGNLCSGLYRINGRLFYNDTDSIYSIKPDGTDKRTEFTPEKTGNNQIFYSAYRNGKVVYALQTGPVPSEKQTVLTAKIEGISESGEKEGLDLPNFDQTYSGIDGSTLSSRADGKPKLLVFFMWDQNAGKETMQNITGIIDSLSGVDVYAIDMTQSSSVSDLAKDTREYKQAYGCDEIQFAYADWYKPANYDKGDAYQQAAGLWGMYLPLMCYIDKDNKLQWVSDHEQSGTQILANLEKYCGYHTENPPEEQGTYEITYVLDGGTNDSANPATYTAETETIILADAVREGYIFEGWYKDAGFNEKVTQILQGSTGDITLYAKWRAGAAPDDPDDPNDPNDQDDTGTYQVVFNVQGHGTAPKTLADIKAGSTIDSPEEPAADGYRFDGWYKDAACTKSWDFGVDTVQSNLTLYAKWLAISSDGEFAVQEITNLYYTGKAQKPAVSVYDENTLLKAGKDYTLKYYNNTNANKDGVLKGETFNTALPYVEITGKGNYKETVKINFNILPASIGNDSRPATGVTLKVNDQLVKANKDQKPFSSIKCGRNMKEGTDYILKLQAVSALNQNGEEINGTEYTGAKVLANYTGEFMLTVTGTGNYTGSISRKVYVADKEHLMKNVKITLGKDLKNIPYSGSGIELKAAAQAKPANDEFAVTYGKTVLIKDKDYEVAYNNNVGVGKAELIVTGKNGYVGSKTATFNIKGKTFANGTVTVTGLADQTYTGRAIVQDAVLTWKDGGKTLVYGEDYTVSYSKNINKGTATVTYTGKAAAGYSGKISKKFKITAANISEMTRAQSMNTITLPYTKAGVKPVDEIILTNDRGIRLSNGKDYTLTYKNNKAVADASAVKAPTVTVKGKGNYSGSFDVKFTIESAGLHENENSNITVECAQVMYVPKKAQGYEYKPAVTIKDGKTKLKAGKDYEIRYERNTQKDFMYYMMREDEKLRPVAVITAKEGSGYTLQEPLEVTLQIYHMAKLTKNNLEVEIGDAVYNGGQVRPEVTVRYWWQGASCEFTEDKDYTLIYGTNTAAGKNKGSVTIKGLVPMYGGSVTYKFDIIKKDLKYGVSPVIDEK